MQENNTNYLFAKGKKVEVSEEVYRGYVRPERAYKKREQRRRKKVAVCSMESLSEQGFEMEDYGQDLEAAAIRDEKISAVRAAIEKLSERDRQIITLYFFEGKTQSEIARILGVKQCAVSRILPRIFERLKKFLNFLPEECNN